MNRVFQIAQIMTMVGVGFFLGLAVASASAFEEWLLQWQTLIAGILAVAAAVITVDQMRRSDEKQEKRHEQLMRLSLRHEMLKISRSKKVAEQLQRIGVEMDRQSAVADTLSARSLGARLAGTLKHELLTDVKVLFGPDMAINYDILCGRVDDWLEAVTTLETRRNQGFQGERAQVFTEAVETGQKLIRKGLAQLQSDIEALVEQYR